MNSFLVDSFKNCCNARLKHLLASCYILIDYIKLASTQPNNSISTCQIYVPSNLSDELFVYEKELISIANLLDINIVSLIPIEAEDLIALKKESLLESNLTLSRFYLELKYLF